MKIGIDVGGTKTEGILIDNLGKELARNRIKTEKIMRALSMVSFQSLKSLKTILETLSL